VEVTKLWLDDVRPAPPGWLWVYTVDEAIGVIMQGGITEISLDNDLGATEPEGYKVADWIEEQAVLGKLERINRLAAHTQNMCARDRMTNAFRNAVRAWDGQDGS